MNRPSRRVDISLLVLCRLRKSGSPFIGSVWLTSSHHELVWTAVNETQVRKVCTMYYFRSHDTRITAAEYFFEVFRSNELQFSSDFYDIDNVYDKQPAVFTGT